MIRKIVWGVLALGLLAVLGGLFLWWLGGRAAEEERRAAAAREAAQQAAERAQFISDLQDVPTTTLAVASQALAEKQAPLARLSPAVSVQSQYTLTDLTLAKTDQAADRRIYGQKMKQILDNYRRGLVGDETALMLEALKTGDPNGADALNRAVQNVQNALSQLKLLTVPASASLLHLQLLNSLASLGQISYNMSQFASEPLLALQSADQRNAKYLAVINAIGNLDRYLAATGPNQ